MKAQLQLVVVLGAIFAPGIVHCQGPTADSVWAKVIEADRARVSNRAPDYEQQWENVRVWHRELGLRFFVQFPDDPRRWSWLLRTMELPPSYSGSVVPSHGQEGLDDLAATARNPLAWQIMFKSRLKPEFLAAANISDGEREKFLRLEVVDLRNQLDRIYGGKPRLSDRASLDEFATALLHYSATPFANSDWIRPLVGKLFSYLQRERAGSDCEQAIATILASSGNADLQLLAAGKQQLLKLSSHPLAINLKTFEGSEISLEQLRGKVVLVDIWSLACISCVQAMPKVRKLSDRFHEAGFEVVTICLVSDELKERDRITKILEKNGSPKWVNAYISGPDRLAFMRKYSIIGVPVSWLLGADGRLLRQVSSLQELEAELPALLSVSANK